MSIVNFSVDDATYVGDEDDGCYYQTAEGPDGWYVTLVVDCNTSNFVDTIFSDDGPHASEEKAAQIGRDAAVAWCLNNCVEYDQE